MKETYIALCDNDYTGFYATSKEELIDILQEDGVDMADFTYHCLTSNKKLKLTLVEE